MKEEAKMEKRLALKVILAVLFSISFISAVGVSSPYWNTNPLKLGPGESTIFSLGLQNMVGGENVTLQASIAKGSDIAKIIDKDSIYFVRAGSNNEVTVNIEVKIPQNAEVDKSQDIEISFVQVSSSEEKGFFQVASAFMQRIPVLVVGEPTESSAYKPSYEKSSDNILWIALAVIILGIIIFFVSRKSGKKGR